MITEEDDDTHICLKCHTTITGLDNYVSHRKNGCGSQSSHSKPRTLSPLIPPDEPDFALKADDFFSLLELQSSSKKPSISVPSGGKTNSGVLTRSKATAVIQASNIHRGSDWIGGHQLRELGNEDNQTKLIKAVDNISGNIKKDEPARVSYEDDIDDDSNDDYDDEEEDFEDDNAPPRTHTGGKWKPSTSPIEWLRPSTHTHETNDWEPPPTHTGGKWKPMLPPSTRRVSEGEDEEDKNIPPPDHTKGKWIPGRNIIDSTNHEDIPPLRKSSGTVQYWCGPCNRRLASKIVYERHLRSELHYKRTLHEREFENTLEYLNQKPTERKRAEGKRKIKKPEHIWHNLEVKKRKQSVDKKEKIRKVSYIRCDVCRSKVLSHLMGKHLISHYHCRKRNIFKPVSQQMVLDHIFGIVIQCPFQCSVCRFYCNEETDFLKHWQSDAHISTSESSSGFFLCLFCKYESKDNDIMEEHLLSDTHREVVSVINRSVPIIIKRIVPVQCTTCNKQFRFNAELRKHCLKENHILSNSSTDKYQERHCCSDCNLVMKSYKSLQRHLLRRHGKNYFFCSTCAMTFNSEMESKQHRKTSEHKYAVITKNYEKGYGSKDITKACQYCYLRFPNVMYLKEHLQKEHPEHCSSCPQCGLKFILSQEVTQHIKSKSCVFPSTSATCFFNCEKCPYKTNSEGDFLFHLALHTDPIPSFSTNSTSTNVSGNTIMQYKCPVCQKIFRKGSLRCHVRQHANEKPFKCDQCSAAYARKSNLVDHMKTRHEEDFKKKEGQNLEHFEESDQLQRNQQETNKPEMKKNEENKLMREKKYLCADCGKSFLKKFTLQQHGCTHTGKAHACDHTGCMYRARTSAELRIHAATHNDAKPFACPHCEHRTKSKSQLTRHMKIHEGDAGKKYICSFCSFSARVRSHLKRHLRLHTGAKPYKCPHCSYSCNNLENLRKHILSTNKHPGKSIYTCTWCSSPEEYATNFAKEFHIHLVTSHGDRFDMTSAKEAASGLLGIYNAEEDEKIVEIKGNKEEKAICFNPPKAISPIPMTSSLPSTSTMQLSTSTSTRSVFVPTTTTATLVDPELLNMVVVREDVIFVNSEHWIEGLYGEEATALVNYEDEQGLLGGQHQGFEEEET